MFCGTSRGNALELQEDTAWKQVVFQEDTTWKQVEEMLWD
jgi:hypothetical protein